MIALEEVNFSHPENIRLINTLVNSRCCLLDISWEHTEIS